MLHALAQFTFDEEEKEELLYLCGGAQWQREFYQRNIMHQVPFCPLNERCVQS
jgi:hypothetical protein